MSPDGTMTGGILRGIEDGWFMAEIAEAAFAYQQKLEKGDKRVVGVNCHTDTVEKPIEILRVSHEVEVEQVARPGAHGGPARSQPAVDAALGRHARGRAIGREHDPADDRRGERGGHPRRDLRRPARRVGRVLRGAGVLSRSRWRGFSVRGAEPAAGLRLRFASGRGSARILVATRAPGRRGRGLLWGYTRGSPRRACGRMES